MITIKKIKNKNLLHVTSLNDGIKRCIKSCLHLYVDITFVTITFNLTRSRETWSLAETFTHADIMGVMCVGRYSEKPESTNSQS